MVYKPEYGLLAAVSTIVRAAVLQNALLARLEARTLVFGREKPVLWLVDHAVMAVAVQVAIRGALEIDALLGAVNDPGIILRVHEGLLAVARHADGKIRPCPAVGHFLPLLLKALVRAAGRVRADRTRDELDRARDGGRLTPQGRPQTRLHGGAEQQGAHEHRCCTAGGKARRASGSSSLPSSP